MAGDWYARWPHRPRDADTVAGVKLSVALRLGRVSNLPTVTTNVLAALALSGATPAPWSIAVICAAISLLYIAGMFLNDAFDRTIDALQRPERPIPSGQVTAAVR